jgi:hypothetical protein
MIAIGACRTIDRSDPIAESPADPPQGKTLRSPWQHHKRRMFKRDDHPTPGPPLSLRQRAS